MISCFGGDLASTWIKNLDVHAEHVISLVKMGYTTIVGKVKAKRAAANDAFVVVAKAA